VLDGGFEADTMSGGAGNDSYVVDNIGDVVSETFGNGVDTVHSSISYKLGAALENLTLLGTSAIDGSGNDLANVISGNDGANILAGGLAFDFLTGGGGSDTFLFDTKLAEESVDHITDFVAPTDHIGLDADVFRKVNDGGALKKKFFAEGKADDGNDYIVYKEKNGGLYYDKDGDGHAKGKLFAILDGSPDDLKAADFLIL
jgi:Ca2+-binding RTX toxin-like protein